MDWPESVRQMQRNWIGKSEGTLINFPFVGSEDVSDPSKKIQIFTTRPETIFGATFLAVSPDSPLLSSLIAPTHQEVLSIFFILYIRFM